MTSIVTSISELVMGDIMHWTSADGVSDGYLMYIEPNPDRANNSANCITVERNGDSFEVAAFEVVVSSPANIGTRDFKEVVIGRCLVLNHFGDILLNSSTTLKKLELPNSRTWKICNVNR